MIEECSSWDEDFFQKFISISHRFYIDNRDYIKESLDDFKKILAPHAPFNKFNDWKAWIIIENNIVVGRVFASTRTDHFKQLEFLPFGYFEATSFDNAKILFELVENYAATKGYNLIKGPINGNVFNQSRFMTKKTRKLFLGEPLHKEEYVEYFKNYNFEVSQKWISCYFTLFQRAIGILKYLKQRKKRTKYKKDYHIRQIDLNNLNKEIELFYNLMMDSYSSLDDFEAITLDEFKVLNEGLKFLVEPKNCLILEHQNEAIAFLFAIRDKRRHIARLSKKSNIFTKFRFYLAKKFQFGTLLMNHVGKKKDAEDKVRAVAIKLFNKLAITHKGFVFTPSIFGFMSEKSKMNEFVDQKYLVSSEYCMFHKKISL